MSGREQDIVERLRVPCFEIGLDECWIDPQRREAAEEIERLRAALRRLRDCDWVITLPDRMDAVRKIAREALDE